MKIKIYGNDEKVITTAKSISEYKKSDNAAYLDVVLTEAIEILADKYNCSAEKAEKKLLNGEYHIYTSFDALVFEKLKNACEKDYDFNIGAAITNLDGDLLAVTSVSSALMGKDENYSIKTNSPCSAFKPLSVYAPAIENKIITWSTTFNDSPYSWITNDDGSQKGWPKNANNQYSMKEVTVTDAVKVSLNTVAVKCLAQVGVTQAIDFLQNNFDIALDYEKEQAQKLGGDEVIGNIALGSLNQGCSTVDMAGYYQAFANGGKYCKPKAIVKICDSGGEVIYERKKESKQVISAETSQIVNQLLQVVVDSGEGTGKDAFCKNLPVAGKTGTNDNNTDNWFVGVTPQYSCAVWHSGAKKNNSPKIFAEIMNDMSHDIKLFQTSPNVTKKIYCLESGKLASKDCKTFELGYYAYGTYIATCDLHK